MKIEDYLGLGCDSISAILAADDSDGEKIKKILEVAAAQEPLNVLGSCNVTYLTDGNDDCIIWSGVSTGHGLIPGVEAQGSFSNISGKLLFRQSTSPLDPNALEVWLIDNKTILLVYVKAKNPVCCGNVAGFHNYFRADMEFLQKEIPINADAVNILCDIFRKFSSCRKTPSLVNCIIEIEKALEEFFDAPQRETIPVES